MNDMKKQYGIIAIILAAIIFFFGALYGTKNPLSPGSSGNNAATESSNITVQITGAVENEGAFELPKASRLKDLLDLAKPLAVADLSDLNLASYLEDGEEIRIASAKNDSQAPALGKLININSATHEELQTLPGIGKVKADSIINYRDNNGPFKKTSDIKKVSGIGDATYEKFKDLICVD